MSSDWSRRALLSTLGIVSIAGCLSYIPPVRERPTEELPAECPKSTLADFGPPEDLSRGAVKTFVTEYHKSYILIEQFSSNTHERTFVSATVTSIRRHEYGYVVVVDWDGADYRSWTELIARRATDPPEYDLPSVESLNNTVLREAATEAAQNGNTWVEVSSGDSEKDAKDAIPEEMRREFESLPGGERGRYVTVDGTPIQFRLLTDTLHGDNRNMTTRYYIDSHVVRQIDEYSAINDDIDPMQFPLLECQP